MKQVILDLLTQAKALIEENISEIRERCSDPLHAKFVGLHASIGDAIREGALDTPVDVAVAPAATAVTAIDVLRGVIGDKDPVALLTGLAQQVSDHLGDRIALEVRAALDEAKA